MKQPKSEVKKLKLIYDIIKEHLKIEKKSLSAFTDELELTGYNAIRAKFLRGRPLIPEDKAKIINYFETNFNGYNPFRDTDTKGIVTIPEADISKEIYPPVEKSETIEDAIQEMELQLQKLKIVTGNESKSDLETEIDYSIALIYELIDTLSGAAEKYGSREVQKEVTKKIEYATPSHLAELLRVFSSPDPNRHNEYDRMRDFNARRRGNRK